MTRFVEGLDRTQGTLFPERLEDYIAEDNPVRVIDVFVEQLELGELGFERIHRAASGRPAYHPGTLLKIYIYGYLNRIQSTRRLERESQRNVELMWLTGQLSPDFKTLADFRRDNSQAIRGVCREFMVLCRKLKLFTQTLVAIDGSKFKAVNSHDRNFTREKVRRRIAQIDQSIERYLSTLDVYDQAPCEETEAKATRLKQKIERLKVEMSKLKTAEKAVAEAPDKQVSLTDPDARSMPASKGGRTVRVGYNVQTAVDAEHHLIVTHEVTNTIGDRNFLTKMATRARTALGSESLTVLADRGYFKGEEVAACEEAGMTPFVPKPQTSNNKARGLFDRSEFIYLPEENAYRCPAGEQLIWRFRSVESGRTMDTYWSSNCGSCALKARCTRSTQRRIKRWEHEAVLEAMQKRLDREPDKMALRKQIVEHPYGTIKSWMGATHFLTRGLKNVNAEMSLHVLAYNLKRLTAIMGVKPLIEAMQS